MGTTAHLSTVLIDHYQIEREIGEGGVAAVYPAHDLEHDRGVALEMFKAELPDRSSRKPCFDGVSQ